MTNPPKTAKPIPVVNFSAALFDPLDPELPVLPELAVSFVPLTPELGLLTLPVQTNPLPLTTPLFWISGNGHRKVSEDDWTLTLPDTSLIDGREALLKEPVQSIEPPISDTLGNPLMVSRSVLFAMRKVPPMFVSAGKERLVRDEQLTKESELPTEVKLGAEMEVRVVVKKPKLLVTLERALKLMDSMSRKEALLTVRSSGRLTVSWGAFAAIERAPLTSCNEDCSIDFKKRLLSMSVSDIKGHTDIEISDRFKRDAGQSGQLSIRDLDIGSGTNSKGHGVKQRKNNKIDASNGSQRTHCDGGQCGQIQQFECATNTL